MFHIDNQIRPMRDASPGRGQYGFSLIEVIVATTVMLIVVGAVFSLVKSSMKVAMTTYELTDAQQNLRTAQEFINRDIMNAGDGLKSISYVRIPDAFFKNYIAIPPAPTPTPGSSVNLSIFTTDNAVPAGTAITGANPAANILPGTDRQTILELDPEFNDGQAITLTAAPVTINASGSTVTIPITNSPPAAALPAMTIFQVGEIYFFSSDLGGTFATITAIDGPNRRLSFTQGDDQYLLNNTGANGHIKFISDSGTKVTSLQRMKMIQYYVTDTKLLMRRVFGIQGVPLSPTLSGARASIIAEHVLDVQFLYSLITTDDATGVVTALTSTSLATSEQRLAVRHVEVKVTVETPHAVNSGGHQSMTMTTSTSVRNMQFRKAL